MNLKDFSSYLSLPVSDAVKQVFDMYDKDNDGFIDFKEFLIGLCLLSQPVNTEDTIKLAFKIFDKDKKGFISLVDLQSILYTAFKMNPVEVEVLFNKIDTKKDGCITFEELKSYAKQRPEYAKIFLILFNDLKSMRSKTE